MDVLKPSKQTYASLHLKASFCIAFLVFALLSIIALGGGYGALFAMVSAPFALVAYLISNFITLCVRGFIEKNVFISFISIFLTTVFACYISFIGGGLLLSGNINLTELFSKELSGLHILILIFSAAYGFIYSAVFYILKSNSERK